MDQSLHRGLQSTRTPGGGATASQHHTLSPIPMSSSPNPMFCLQSPSSIFQPHARSLCLMLGLSAPFLSLPAPCLCLVPQRAPPWQKCCWFVLIPAENAIVDFLIHPRPVGDHWPGRWIELGNDLLKPPKDGGKKLEGSRTPCWSKTTRLPSKKGTPPIHTHFSLVFAVRDIA